MRALVAALLLVPTQAVSLGAQVSERAPDSVSVRLVNVELRAAVQVLGQYLDRPIIVPSSATTLVTLESPVPVARESVLRLLRGLVESQGFELAADTAAGIWRVKPREVVRPPAAPGGVTVRGGPVELFVLPLRHARAVDVASMINALYGRGTPSSGDAGRPSTLGEELRAAQSGSPSSQPPAVAPRPSALTGELTVVADTRGNSLLVRANAGDVELVRAVVTALDVRPLQVLIEVIIAEVRKDRTLSLSVDAELGQTAMGHHGATVEGSMGAAGLGDFAMRVMRIGGLDLDGTLRMASARGDVRILTRPVLLATNNERAEIVVGSQRPFVQVSRSLPTDAASRDQIVQYKEVGTKLNVRPTISRDGSVQLEVTQEISTATAEVAFNAPVIATRSLSTQLLVSDGQTVALGGLVDQLRESQQSGVPVLSAIPLLGGLLGSAKRGRAATELFIFITPRIIRTDEDAARLTVPLRERTSP
jgi:general secretion pathway protein D